MIVRFVQRFCILSLILLFATTSGPADGDSPVSDWVERFCRQIIKSLPAKPRRGVIILQRFENGGKENPEFLSEVFQSVKTLLQKQAGEIYEASSEEEARALAQRLRDEDILLVRGVLSETLTRINLTARISYPKRQAVAAVALSSLEKKLRRRAPGGPAGTARHLILQEVYRSTPLPLKVLDATIAELTPERPPMLFLLSEDALLGFRFENDTLISDFKATVPAESEGLASRDPRGLLALYHHQNRDHILAATHRSGGTFLLRESGGNWSFVKLSSDWLFKSRRPPAKPAAVSARLTPGKNYFSGEVGRIDFVRLVAQMQIRIRSESAGDSADLTIQSPFTLRGKIANYHQLNFADQESSNEPLILANGLDGALHFYDAQWQEVNVIRGTPVGSVMATHYDADRNATYLFTTAPSIPQTNDAVTVWELKDRVLKSVTKTNSYPGSISALAVGHIAGRDGLTVVAVLESLQDFAAESIIYIFSLRG